MAHQIPLIRPAIILAFIFSIIGTLQLFTEPRTLIAVIPSVIGPNFTPNLYVYNLAFRNRQFDYSASIAFSIALVTAILAGSSSTRLPSARVAGDGGRRSPPTLAVAHRRCPVGVGTSGRDCS